MTIWLWLAAPFIGVLLGVFGAGGGMLTVPLLVYGGGFELKLAIAMSVWIVAVVSLIAALHQRVWRLIQPRLLLFFAIGGILGAIFGAKLGMWVAAWAQQTIFSLLIFLVAWWMRRIKLTDINEPNIPCHCPKTFLMGLVMGSFTGLLGVGGGFLMVPALVLLGVSHLPTAVAHSLVLIACNAFAAGVTYLEVMPLTSGVMLGIMVLAGIGSLIGGLLLKKLPVQRIQGGFSLLLVCIGVGMFVDLFL